MVKSPFLSVVMPSYNEQASLQRSAIDEVLTYLNAQSYTWELILSDDGSTDGTTNKLHELAKGKSQVRVLPNIHRGKGPTVQTGMLAALGEWRLFTDFDQSTPISEVEKLMEFTKKYEVVIGSRELKGATRDQEPWYRHLMGRGFNMMVQMLAIPGIQDTQCGFKLLSAEATEKLFGNLRVYGASHERNDAFTGAFDVELLYLAKKFGYKIKEVPILWHHHETKRVSPIKDSLRMLKDIVKVRLADLQHQYP